METRALIDEYLLDCKDRGLSGTTLVDYACTLAVLAVICPMQPATVEHINRVFRKMMVDRSTSKLKRKSLSTKWKYRKNLTAFFRWVEKRYGLRNPCQDLGRWNPPDTLPRYYTREEIDRIAAAVLTDIERALIALLLDNGLRIGEVASLLKSRIKDGCVMVRGKRGGRRVPVSPEVIAMLKALGKGNVIWMGRKGRLNAGALAQICRNVIVRAGITGEGRGPHTLRHTFATWYLKRGGHLLNLKEILGHKHLTQTLVYLHLSGADVDEDHAQFSPFRQLGLFSQDGGPGSGPAGECQCDCGRLNLTTRATPLGDTERWSPTSSPCFCHICSIHLTHSRRASSGHSPATNQAINSSGSGPPISLTRTSRDSASLLSPHSAGQSSFSEGCSCVSAVRLPSWSWYTS